MPRTTTARDFRLYAELAGANIRQMYVESVRDAVAEGFETTLRATYQDASDAAVHWMIGTEHSDPRSRALGPLHDLRGTKRSGLRHPWVGVKGEKRSERDAGLAGEVVVNVLAREISAVINRHIRGNVFDIDIVFYNAVMDNPKHAMHASLVEAGEAGVGVVLQAFDRLIEEGNSRLRFR